jgi:trans-aconitate 2-methyltransferase
MIEQARRNFPRLHFEIADILAPPLVSGFDAVFSNAVLHWVKDAEQAVENIACMVKPGGRFVAEFGGHGNVRRLLRAVFAALEQLGVDEPQRLNPWYFPTVGEYAAVLERHGFEVSYAALFDRLTALDPGAEALAQWLQMFGPTFIEELDSTRRAEFVRLTEDHAREHLFRDGVWHADYRRIRVVAVRRVS